MASPSLSVEKHPTAEAQGAYDRLVGIDAQKQALLDELLSIFDTEAFGRWLKKFHPKGLPVAERFATSLPVVALSGEVGCGKTQLAQAIGSPLAKALNASVTVLTTPSNIRGSGHVGELSSRITEAFDSAKAQVPKHGYAILVIDEADDLTTSRDQDQAHHEDRAGLNVLIKQLDSLQKEKSKIAVIMITNRIDVLDPAVRRRFSLELKFERPEGPALTSIFERILEGTNYSQNDVARLVSICKDKKPKYTYSDLFLRVGRQALVKAQHKGVAFGVAIFEEVLLQTEPSPAFKDN